MVKLMKILDLKKKIDIKDEKSHIIKVLFDKYVSYLFDHEIILCDKVKMLGLVFESDNTGMYAMFDRAVIDSHEKSMVLTNNVSGRRKIEARLHIKYGDKLNFYDIDYVSMTR